MIQGIFKMIMKLFLLKIMPDEYKELLKYQENNLPVPIEQKDNEKFKILKMKQMKSQKSC